MDDKARAKREVANNDERKRNLNGKKGNEGTRNQ